MDESDAAIEAECLKCPLRSMKPEPVPGWLAEWIGFVEEHEALHSKGITFAARDYTPEQKAALLGKVRAETRRRALDDLRQRKERAMCKQAPKSTLPHYTGRPLHRL